MVVLVYQTQGGEVMSTGLLVCNKCMREIHQRGDRKWFHCEDKTLLCEGASGIYPKDDSEIKGKWCGCDRGDVGILTENFLD